MGKKFIFCFFILSLTQALWGKDPVVYFTSETDISAKCIESIEKERVSIRIASKRLSNIQVITALSEAYKRGVFVEVIVDAETLTRHSRLRILANEGVLVSVWKPEGKKKDRLHHSFCVFGKKLCWVGSYSFSLQKKFRHKESIVVFEDEAIAERFLGEFESIKTGSCISFLDYCKEL